MANRRGWWTTVDQSEVVFLLFYIFNITVKILIRHRASHHFTVSKVDKYANACYLSYGCGYPI